MINVFRWFKLIPFIFISFLSLSFTVSSSTENQSKDQSNSNVTSLVLTNEEKRWLQQHPTLKVHNELDWAPFNYNEKGIPTGFSIEYMNSLANIIGIEVEYVSGEWGELLEKAINKELDVMLNIVKTPERQKHLIYTSSYTKNSNVIVSLEGNNISDINSLSRPKISLEMPLIAFPGLL